MDEKKKIKVNVYIDGFNFYYGLKNIKWKKFYWLDIVSFFELFMKPNQELNKVYYFSAKPHNQGQKNRQGVFFKANQRNPKFQLVLGKFLEKKVTFGGKKYSTYEEKQTDVNIAVTLLRCVFTNECDSSIVVTADSDLSPAIKLAKELNPKHMIFGYMPPERTSVTLTKCCNAILHLKSYENRFKKCILDDSLTLEDGTVLTRPVNWI
ncbi:NYN domain-containing protein [Sphingobacterium sp. InxBP1]|uniref:NYN domain-containing protein n=1 Tax=Sphingobacterium sp. InxBP1 TaxID=2870328 RepID=UPI0022436299|nr:NYN domain-containing protein [Sphingobacterium sp. InxBP1]MCW8314203.1 NYN domain-containing protein [Sphingobacterium sp. InxBP1]